MRSMTGIRRAGLLAVLAAVLLPASGIGTAVADLTVGEEVMLKVPDVSQFGAEPAIRQFTVRAETEHAYWLVQDTTYFDTEEPLALWPEYFDQTELDSLTEMFEGGGVNVYGAVTSGLAEPQTTVNEDDKIWIVFADIPDEYQGSTGAFRAGIKRYVWPDDFDGDAETANNHDCIYINIGVYRDVPAPELKSYMHTIAVPAGLAEYIRTTYNVNESRWLVRGLGVVGQYLTYGFTNYGSSQAGIAKDLEKFQGQKAWLELILFNSGGAGNGVFFDSNEGAALLFLMYAQQNTSGDILPAITTCTDYVDMYNIGMAVDPSADSSTVIDDVIFPLYNDYIIANAISSYAADFEGGKYHYDFLDGTGFELAVIDKPGSLDGDVTEYPMATTLTPVMRSPVFSARYFALLEPPEGATVYFNGQYNQNNGSGSNYNGKWYAWRIVKANNQITGVDQIELDDMYNGSFQLGGDSTFVVTTNNNWGGQAELAMIYSQDTAAKEILMALMQNPANPQYIQAYTSLFYVEDGENVTPYGFDWAGPGLTATRGDSTLMAPMEKFSGTIWGGVINLWEAGDYDISCTGWDSLGIAHTETAELECGYSEQEGMVLNITEARLDVEDGSGSPGQMVVLMETGMLGLSVSSSIPIGGAAEAMTGVIAGPVSVSDVAGNLSFPANDSHGAVYRWNGEGWDRIESSYYQSGRMHAMIDGGGIYVYGEAPGVVSPEVPAEMGINGSYPNPFVAQAAISFSLPQAGRAAVKVFDLSGRLVTTLADGEMAAADHTLVWDGCDASGNEVGAGVYFCRLEANGQTATQKMLRIE